MIFRFHTNENSLMAAITVTEHCFSLQSFNITDTTDLFQLQCP